MIPSSNGVLPRAGDLPARDMLAAARTAVVGRTVESEVLAAALAAGRSILLEGPPGTGKTTLLRALADGAGVGFELVEGNAELSPTRLVGHHDPSRVLTEDYRPDNFVAGPLVRALTTGALLYVEELNRVPEETLNVLLGVLSERRLHVPRLGVVDASTTFRLVAAMNPSDGVGTGRITPALYDRSCRVAFDHQSQAEEHDIVVRSLASPGSGEGPDEVPGAFVARAVAAARATRTHPDLRLGSSVRGAQDLVALAASLAGLRGERVPGEETGADAARAALTGRVTLVEGCPRTAEEVVTAIWAATAPAEPGEASSGSPETSGSEPGKA